MSAMATMRCLTRYSRSVLSARQLLATRRRLAHDEPGHLRRPRLVVAGGHAVVADLGRRHRDDLTGVGRVGQHFLVAGHAGVEDHFAVRLAGRAGGNTAVPGAVFEGKCGVHECRAALRVELALRGHCRAGVTAPAGQLAILARDRHASLCVPCLDTARERSEHSTVSVHPNAGVAAAASVCASIIRRFPWINRLAADYAFDFDRLSPFFYRRRPRIRSAWRRPSRARRPIPASATRVAVAHRRRNRPARGAPPPPVAAAEQPARPANGRHRHRPAGGPVRRTALSPCSRR